MGTFNFNKNIDFETGIYQADEIYIKSDFDDVDTPTDEEFNAFLSAQAESDFEFYEEEVENFNNTLKFYKIELKAGYYDGFQTNVTSYEQAYDGERLTRLQLDNCDTQYAYNMNLSTFKRKEQAEFNKINKFIKKLFPQIIIVNGWCPVYSKIGE